MYLLTIPLPHLEIAAFVVALVAFLLAVRFFIITRKRLRGLLPEKSEKSFPSDSEMDRDGFWFS